MCLSCQYLPPADELNLQLALSVTGNCVRIHICMFVCGCRCLGVSVGVAVGRQYNMTYSLPANRGKID